jgi:cation diffusion facilitator CzcD-associated flavoprotein CzcO
MTTLVPPAQAGVQFDVDVAVIGAGTAGLAAYRAARASGARAIVIEGGASACTWTAPCASTAAKSWPA